MYGDLIDLLLLFSHHLSKIIGRGGQAPPLAMALQLCRRFEENWLIQGTKYEKIWSAIRDCFGNRKIFCLAIYPFVWQSRYFLACQFLNLACHLACGNTAILHPMIIPWQWFNSLSNGVGLPSKCFMVFGGILSIPQKLLPRSQKLIEWKLKFSNNFGRSLAKWEYYLLQLHFGWEYTCYIFRVLPSAA